MDNFLGMSQGRKIVLFGAGELAVDYIRKYGGLFRPLFLVDNNASKWGTNLWEFPVESPERLRNFAQEEILIVICSRYGEEIAQQLRQMAFTEYYIYQCDRDYIGDLQNSELSDGLPKYNIGYVPGVYDLFHIGHLNLIKKSKARCDHLIVGVLTDELVYHFKKKYPYIPCEERVAIIESIKYVDQVIVVDFSNTIKMDAWKQLKFDCHFSGDDHLRDWDVPIKQLRKVGSNMEFFSYTKTTSSTMIKDKLKN